MLLRNIYYKLKPLIPRSVQIALRRRYVAHLRERHAHVWPIDKKAAAKPAGWKGWPEGKRFAVVLTHDTDTERGQGRCRDLMELEKGLGFCSSFNFVPRRYDVCPVLRKTLVENGFEVGVHGLYHDGKYYESREEFSRRAKLINEYLKDWDAVGFRSPSMLHNLDWIHELDIEYDASTFDTDPFEPQSDGMGTIFPFWVAGKDGQRGYVELPYTLPQDFLIFVMLEQKDPGIWMKKLDWIAEKGGMVLMNTHPDYMAFGSNSPGIEEFPADYYARFLQYLKEKYAGEYWHALPRDMARHVSGWRAMQLVGKREI
jgi:hypothetical protein